MPGMLQLAKASQKGADKMTESRGRTTGRTERDPGQIRFAAHEKQTRCACYLTGIVFERVKGRFFLRRKRLHARALLHGLFSHQGAQG